MRLRDIPIGGYCVMVERMDDGEVRRTVYQVRFGTAINAGFVPVFRLHCTQGMPGHPPRYDRAGSGYPSEAHGLTPVELLAEQDGNGQGNGQGNGFVTASKNDDGSTR